MKREIKFTFSRSFIGASVEASLVVDSTLTRSQITDLVYDFAGSFCKNVDCWSWSIELRRLNDEKID